MQQSYSLLSSIIPAHNAIMSFIRFLAIASSPYFLVCISLIIVSLFILHALSLFLTRETLNWISPCRFLLYSLSSSSLSLFPRYQLFPRHTERAVVALVTNTHTFFFFIRSCFVGARIGSGNWADLVSAATSEVCVSRICLRPPCQVISII